jgi:murein DD-endopeptidase MepM/ murein hydrolase activator NlpD
MKMKKPYFYFALFVVFLGVLSFFMPYITGNGKYLSKANKLKKSSISTLRLAYGLPADSFEITKGTIRKNVMFSDILNEFSIPASVIRKIELSSKGIIDFRKIKAGNIFAFLKPKNQDNKSQYFVYEHSPTEYYFVEITDSITVEKRQKKIQTYHKTVSGIINTSLWNSMEEQQINPMVAIELSEIFAWSIDFFGLQKGDAFKLMYDEQIVDTVAIGIGQIHGAWFKHAGKEFTAIPFEQDGSVEFFDADGNSLRKAFLKAPLRFSRISSHFTGCRYHPVLHRNTTHYGVDYAAPSGTPVYAIGDGTIISAGWNGGAGNMVKIKHNSIYTTGYMHLRAFGPGIRGGSYVKQGDVIGYVGSTGLSTGPHLDFRIWHNNSPVNPLTIESPSVEPVKKDNREAFLLARNDIMFRLNQILLPGSKGSSNEVKIYALRNKMVDAEAF